MANLSQSADERGQRLSKMRTTPIQPSDHKAEPELRRRRCGMSHGEGLLPGLAGFEGNYAVASTAPALFTAETETETETDATRTAGAVGVRPERSRRLANSGAPGIDVGKRCSECASEQRF